MSPLSTVEQVECSFQLWGFGSADFSTTGMLIRPWYFGSLAKWRAPVSVPHEVKKCGGRGQDDISRVNLIVSWICLPER